MGRYARTRLAVAAAATLAVASTGAWGLGLGRLTVQSALGETLKAEIDITSLTPEEAGSLKVRIAPPEAYRSTGVEYNPVLTTTQVQVNRRDGRTYLRVSSDRAVQEPFVDVILELTWSSGRLVREYTLLFDPPTSPRPAAPPAVATAPVISPAPVATAPVQGAAPAATTPLPATPRPQAPVSRPSPAPTPTAAVAATGASEYTVRPGDTLSKVASKTQAPGISLDQMLVGLYRANPDAFIDNNMNLLKSGSVLQVPGSDSLGSLSSSEARQVIQAQSADFSAYRQRLAGAAPTLKSDQSERQAKGSVQAAVEERKPSTAQAPDKLTLSKAGKAASAAEAKISKETEKKDAATRVAELTRNVEELKKLSSAAKPAPAAPATPTPAPAPAPTPIAAAPVVAPTLPVPAPAPVASAPVAPVVASAPVVEAASAPKPVMPAPRPKPAPAPAPEPSFLDSLVENPLIPIGALVAVVLVGFGVFRMRSRKNQVGHAETGFHESRLQPDSFFGASGGQRVDTRDGASQNSSMSYSLSQLDAIGDVDPVAEADVYLAYGRDLQAEEILKEALRANPERLAIRLKLLEVYAKRRDTKGFESLAIQLFAETKGVGDDWAKAQELGRQIDADNPLYQPGGAPSSGDDGQEIHPEPMAASTLPASVSAAGHLLPDVPTHAAPPPEPVPSGFGMDLDLDLGNEAATDAMGKTQRIAKVASEPAPLSMDFDLSAPAAPPPAAPELDLGNLDLGTTAPAANSLDFDLGSIDLDLPKSAAADDELPTIGNANDLGQALDALGDEEGDPLLRQLELADEFRQIGDTEGAREVLQELIGKASGQLKAKAQTMLAELR